LAWDWVGVGIGRRWSGRQVIHQRAREKLRRKKKTGKKRRMGGEGRGYSLVVTNDIRDVEQASYKERLKQLMLLRVRQRGNSGHAGNLVGVAQDCCCHRCCCCPSPKTSFTTGVGI
jgi:hypothetical protein